MGALLRAIHAPLIVFLFLGVTCAAEHPPLTREQAQCIAEHVDFDSSLNPAYLWGGASLKPGAEKDCSGSLYSYFRACGCEDEDGRPIQRTTANRMAAGLDGWGFPEVAFGQARKLAIVHMTMPAKPGKAVRINGHVGILIVDVQTGVTRMAHASSSWGFIASLVEDSGQNYWYLKITKLRQTH
ncbi:MAG: hypothetical protein WC654_00820 [Patescibacteria group bacterium]